MAEIIPIILPPKSVDDSRLRTFDFLNYVEVAKIVAGGEGEAITSAAVTVLPADLTLGTAAISGTQVQFRVSGGTAGTTYYLTILVSTSGGDTLPGYATMDVVARPAPT